MSDTIILNMTDSLFEQRFSFIEPGPRSILRDVWRDGEDRDDYPLCELVRALADEIDSAAEMASLDKMTPDEIDAELRALGADPEKIRKRGEELRARLTAQLSQR